MPCFFAAGFVERGLFGRAISVTAAARRCGRITALSIECRLHVRAAPTASGVNALAVLITTNKSSVAERSVRQRVIVGIEV